MGNPIMGRTVIGNVGSSVMCLVHGNGDFKHGGVTVDWATVPAAGADTTLPDGVFVASGEKYLRYGQVLTMAAGAEVQVLTIANATGGTFDVTIPAHGNQFAQTATGIAYNATAADVANALAALPGVGAGNVSVTFGSSAWTVTFNRSLGDVPQMTTSVTNLTGAGAAVTPTTSTAGTGTGLYGPYDSAATDGRQTLEKGRVWIVNQTVKENDLKSNHPPVFDGGRVWRQRILATDGTHSLAAGPTFAELLAAMPSLRFAWD